MSSITTSSFHQKINDSCLWINGTWEQITALHPAPYEMFKYALTWPDLAISTFQFVFWWLRKVREEFGTHARFFCQTPLYHPSEIVSVPLKPTRYFKKNGSCFKKKKVRISELHGIKFDSYSSHVMCNHIFVKYLSVRYCGLSFVSVAKPGGVSLHTV